MKNYFLKIKLLIILLKSVEGLISMFLLSSFVMILRSYFNYSELGVFFLCAYPLSFKVLWSPLVDNYYFKIIGKRKTWIILTNLVSAMLLFYINLNYTVILEQKQIEKLTFLCCIIYFCIACGDLATDGWGLALSKSNSTLASSCTNIGLLIGYNLAGAVFMYLNSEEFCNKYLGLVVNYINKDNDNKALISVEMFFNIMGFYVAFVSLVVAIFPEKPINEDTEDLVKDDKLKKDNEKNGGRKGSNASDEYYDSNDEDYHKSNIQENTRDISVEKHKNTSKEKIHINFTKNTKIDNLESIENKLISNNEQTDDNINTNIGKLKYRQSSTSLFSHNTNNTINTANTYNTFNTDMTSNSKNTTDTLTTINPTKKYGISKTIILIIKILSLKQLQIYLVLLVTIQIAFGFENRVLFLAYMDKGFPKESLTLIYSLATPLQIFVSLHLSDKKTDFFNMFFKAFLFKVLVCFLSLSILDYYEYLVSISDENSNMVYLMITLVHSLGLACDSVMYCCISGFNFYISDKTIGATYYTTLCSFTNFSYKFSSLFIFQLTDLLGYRGVGILSILFGLLYRIFIADYLIELEKKGRGIWKIRKQ